MLQYCNPDSLNFTWTQLSIVNYQSVLGLPHDPQCLYLDGHHLT